MRYVIMVSLLLVGCGSGWKKDGASQAELDVDNNECRTGLDKYPSLFGAAHEYNLCMERKGWKAPEQKSYP